MKFPELAGNLDDFDKYAGRSVDVLVNLDRFAGVVIGRYLHRHGEWHTDILGIVSAQDVAEWWPMPEYGTGNKVKNIDGGEK